jgi:hypothetical protein
MPMPAFKPSSTGTSKITPMAADSVWSTDSIDRLKQHVAVHAIREKSEISRRKSIEKINERRKIADSRTQERLKAQRRSSNARVSAAIPPLAAGATASMRRERSKNNIRLAQIYSGGYN